MLKKLHLPLFMLLSFVVLSQNYKFGRVSEEELSQQQHSSYPDADAAVLYREYKTYYDFSQGDGFTVYTEVFERIKIYNPQGFEWGSKTIPLYNSSNKKEDLVSLKAYTYNLQDGDIEKTKLDKDNIFEKKASNFLRFNEFTMPALQSGSVIEYEYKVSSPFLALEDIELQYTIPIDKEVVEITVPEYFVYKNYGNPQAILSYTFEKNSGEKKITLRGRSGVGTVDYVQGNFGNSRSAQDRNVSYKEDIYSLEESNIPPLPKESYVDNLKNYQARSIWELAYINDPNGVPDEYLSTDWEAVTESIYKNSDFVNQIEKTNYYEEDLAPILANASSPEEIMGSLLTFVKTKVAWNGYTGYYAQNGVKSAYNTGEGNTADINLMLVGMLRSAGLEANPVLVSTVDNGIPVYPTRKGFNYVIASVLHNGQMYLMDATDSYSNVNLLPRRAMNWQGRLIRADGTSNWVGLYPGYTSEDVVYAQAEIKGNSLETNVRERLNGHFAHGYRNKYNNVPNSERAQGIQNTAEDLTIIDFEATNVENLDPNITLRYAATSNLLAEQIGNELYLSPMLFFATKENPFKSDNRAYPIFFEYPKSHKYVINIKYPEGYTVTSLPESIKANLANNMGSYSYILQDTGAQAIQLSVTLELNAPIILPEDYQYIKALFSQIVEKENEKVVLTKV
jgi:transglutaminase-like putative cysteine protease